MSTSFSRTLRSLRADHFRVSVAGILIALFFLGSWLAWAALAKVILYETTSAARTEVDTAAHAVQAPLAGRIVSTRLVIGREVKAGELLVEVDSEPQRLHIREAQSRLYTLPRQIEALQLQVAEEEKARVNEQLASHAVEEEARATLRQAEAPAHYAETEEQRLKELRAEGLIAKRDFERGAADARERRAEVEARQLTIPRLEREQRTRESERDARVRQLEAAVRGLEGDLAMARATINTLQYEVERRSIRSPIDGRIAEAAVLHAGAFVDEGDRLGAIVPAGKLQVIAQFPPPAALGRIRPGQPARMRLEGFPWAQYGSMAASVSKVASEVREGTVRVELTVAARQSTSIPLQHGLPGTVEIEVGQTTPARLLLRYAAGLLTQPHSAFSAGGGN